MHRTYALRSHHNRRLLYNIHHYPGSLGFSCTTVCARAEFGNRLFNEISRLPSLRRRAAPAATPAAPPPTRDGFPRALVDVTEDERGPHYSGTARRQATPQRT